MKSVLLGALGLLVGLGVSSIAWTGCGCPRGLARPHLMGGERFVPLEGFTAPFAAVAPLDYEILVSSDAKEMIETFTSGGHVYEVRYAVEESNEYKAGATRLSHGPAAARVAP